MAVTQLIVQLALELLKLFPNLNILFAGLMEGLPVELFLLVDEEHLVFLSGQNSGQLCDPILCLAQSNNFLAFTQLLNHG